MKPTDTDITPEQDTDLDGPPDTQALTLRHPAVPVTLDELAALRSVAADDIALARVTVVKTLRTHAIALTHPEDWVLFKAPDDDISHAHGYLQDAGCDRIRDLFGCSIYNVSKPEKIAGTDPGSFIYIITGDGRCSITGQVVEGIEGGRSSTDDFCKDLTGAALELTVRKAARANLDGGITRELTGMKAVPVRELERAWQGTGKTIDGCRLGRGFGSRSQRLGAPAENAPNVPPPVCAVCGAMGVYRPAAGNRGAFYGCPKYGSHRDRKWLVDADEWVTQQQEQQRAKP